MTIFAIDLPKLALSPFWQHLIGLGFQIVPKLLWVIAILILTRIAIRLVGNLTRQALSHIELTIRKFLIQVAEISTLLTGLISALNMIGIQTNTIIAVIGAAGLAISLAWQNTLSHFAAGVMLISLRPFEVGDFIEGAGVAGIVDAIGIFSTTLITPDHVKIMVPNAQLFNGTLKNTTALGTRRIDLEIDIGDRPIEPTITMLLGIVQPHPLVLNHPKPTCHVATISATNTILYLRPWCAATVYEQVRSEVQLLIKETLQITPTLEEH